METIPQKTLRNDVGEVLRRVEDGESFIVTVAGRPVAELRPIHRRRWVSDAALAAIWRTPAPMTLAEDLEAMPGDMVDPFDR